MGWEGKGRKRKGREGNSWDGMGWDCRGGERRGGDGTGWNCKADLEVCHSCTADLSVSKDCERPLHLCLSILPRILLCAPLSFTPIHDCLLNHPSAPAPCALPPAPCAIPAGERGLRACAAVAQPQAALCGGGAVGSRGSGHEGGAARAGATAREGGGAGEAVRLRVKAVVRVRQ